jgi:sulfite reductase (NADPH) flavoprotein alpha-component
VTYVQARIAAPEHGPAIARAILQQGAVVFISGSAKRMPSDVIAALRGVLQAHGSMSSEESARYAGAMERGRRLVTEAWS